MNKTQSHFARLAVLLLLATPFAGHARTGAVVADIGPGTNPYHQDFRRSSWTEHPCTVIPNLPCTIPALPLTLGDDYAQNLAADQALWDGYQRGVVYWVPGTNLLLLTLRSWEEVSYGGQTRDGYVGTDGIHGSASSSAAARACPECYILVVQDASSGDGQPLRKLARDYPWVDVVTQTNFPGYGQQWWPEYVKERFAEASRAFADTGRLFFAGSGNQALTSVVGTGTAYTYDVPPWVVLVGGAQSFNLYRFLYGGIEDAPCNASAVNAGKPAEFVGDYFQILADTQSVDGGVFESGTSFATPQVAARFARTLARVREALGDTRAPGLYWKGAPRLSSPALADGKLSAEELRDAFSLNAKYFPTASFDLNCEVDFAARTNPTAPAPIAPVSPTPWEEMGWGYVSGEVAERTAQVLLGVTASGTKAKPATFFMNSFMRARETAFP